MIDLHTHSDVSDGSDSPARIAELAHEAGCSTFALTDHDRLDGLPEAASRAHDLGVQFIGGCELSCEFDATMHVLVYWLEPGEGPLQDELGRIQRSRAQRNTVIVERLAAQGLPISYDEVVAQAGGDGIGRPHVAAVLMRNGAVASIQEAFDVWLAKGKPGYVDRERLSPRDAVSLAVRSRAVPVLAHPLSLELSGSALESTVVELRDAGLAGLEALYGRYTPEDRDALSALATRLGLVVSGGSDYHGDYKPDLRVGSGRGDLDVPDSAVDALAARRSARTKPR